MWTISIRDLIVFRTVNNIQRWGITWPQLYHALGVHQICLLPKGIIISNQSHAVAVLQLLGLVKRLLNGFLIRKHCIASLIRNKFI